MVCTQSSFQRSSPGECSEYFEMMYEYWMSPVLTVESINLGAALNQPFYVQLKEKMLLLKWGM